MDPKPAGIVFVRYREHMHFSKNLLLIFLVWLLMVLIFVCILHNVFCTLQLVAFGSQKPVFQALKYGGVSL